MNYSVFPKIKGELKRAYTPICCRNIKMIKGYNILVVTMGTTWQVVPELLGFTNSELLIYHNHPEFDKISKLREKHGIQPVDKVYVITTGGRQTDNSVEELNRWFSSIYQNIKIEAEIFRLAEVNELASVEECTYMADYIYRVVLKASEIADQLYLSLAGGRKTMSAEMQQAGNFFGCSAMLHVVDKSMSSAVRAEFSKLTFTDSPPEKLISNIMPLVTFGKIEPDAITVLAPSVTSAGFPVQHIGNISDSLYNKLHKRQRDSRNLLFNFTMNLTSGSSLTNFRVLYALSPQVIEQLRVTKPTKEVMCMLPKTELHCHFGGIALPGEMIKIALSNYEKILELKNNVQEYSAFLDDVQKAVDNGSIDCLKRLVPDSKGLRGKFEIPEPYAVAGFLSCFKEEPRLLQKFIYGSDSPELERIGITEYEKLGDLQGSGLLQSEASVRTACRILAEKCRRHNVRYIEVRCSPVNYSRGELNAEEVVKIMMEEFEAVSDIYFNIIFIASRHNRMSSVYRHIELAEEMLEKHKNFRKFFAGFDLAGAEHAGSPVRFREAFLPLMEKCIHLTIHAGETVDVGSVWEAVYYLNADRIGHGLNLIEDRELMRKFREREISIEMCPSSNNQIVGFANNYPLKDYLDFGLKVTVNTDNPGISLTDFSQEYIVADGLCGGLLNLWDIFQLIKNGFEASFVEYDIKDKLISKAEKDIVNIIGDIF